MKGIRADKVYFCTTVFFGILCLVILLFSMKNMEDLEKINEDLQSAIDSNRIVYNENLEEVRSLAETNFDKYAEEYSLRIRMEEELNSGKSSYSKEEVQLLAKCVQAEAGEGNSQSQKMITQVILNRVVSPKFPNTIEEVIYQKDGGIQFSVAYNGSLESQEVTYQTLANVYSVLLFGSDLPFEVQYFYAESLVEDNWVKTLKTYDTVEGTIFAYAPEEE